MTQTAVIIAGGVLDDSFISEYCAALQDGYILIAADSGLRLCLRRGLTPAYIVGDFDSFDGEDTLRGFAEKGAVIRRFRPEKDLTDTQIAAQLAMEQGCTRIHLLGGTGGRLDHLLGNLQIMELCLRKGVRLVMADPHNRITMHDTSFELIRGTKERYVSFVPCGGTVMGLTLTGFKYPLREHDLSTDQTLGISNELTGETGQITFRSGNLLMIRSVD